MGKNLLSDTDYTSGKDMRFKSSVWLGKVSKIECTDKQANVRVIMPDRLDHEGTPLNSKPIPVLQIASQAKKSYAIPRLQDNVLIVKLANATSDYAVIGSFYTKNNPPPVSDPMLDYVLYDDGSTMQFDASKGELTWKIKGNCLIDNEKDFTIKLKGKWDLETQGDITIKSQGNVDIEGSGSVTIKGSPIIMQGNIQHTGSMTTTGIHNAADGPHASCGLAQGELEERIASLERRIAELEARHGN